MKTKWNTKEIEAKYKNEKNLMMYTNSTTMALLIIRDLVGKKKEKYLLIHFNIITIYINSNKMKIRKS